MDADRADRLITGLLAKAASTEFPRERQKLLDKAHDLAVRFVPSRLSEEPLKVRQKPADTYDRSARPTFEEVRNTYLKWKNS